MTYLAQRNAILVSTIDSYCLVCETHIMHANEVDMHILKPVHKKNIAATLTVEKYKDDHILKVRKGYYCVYCNILLPTISKVGIHIADKQHVYNKGSQLLRRVRPWVIAYNEILIDDNAWHGIIDDTCVLCNIEFENENVHKSEITHVLNLVLNKVEFGNCKEIYRRTDDTTFQCITCNLALASHDYHAHFDDQEHKKILLERIKAYQNRTFEQDEKVTEEATIVNNKGQNDEDLQEPFAKEIRDGSNDRSSSSEGFKSECSLDDIPDIYYDKKEEDIEPKSVLQFVSIFEKNEVNINFENELAYCKRCIVAIDFNCDSIQKHIEGHANMSRKVNSSYVPIQCEVNMKSQYSQNFQAEENNKPLQAITYSKPKVTAEIKKSHSSSAQSKDENLNTEKNEGTTPSHKNVEIFAKENNITFNKGNNNAYCRICLKRFPSNLSSMKEHVSGKLHKKNVSKLTANFSDGSSSNPVIYKKYMKDFLDEVLTIENLFGSFKVVNEKYFIKSNSYHLITSNESVYRCHVCEMNVPGYLIEEHVDLDLHLASMKYVRVISSLSSEFVREIRPELYHCGFCNLIVATWKELESHLSSTEHTGTKETAERALRSNLPKIAQYKMQRKMHAFAKMMMLRQMFGFDSDDY